ncbi:hypothetical protein NA56DRAFT_647797 [Hyaloscypha hepaticicola]|uniref:Uncharacterized protein n=1 Tax=Hyaloscypha hepaticicola TaxID=2082293 RepID=A0A2J6PX53_9HELO|nr:hypothetical protein NA56DRAFT_647797 [Hyaloscypha hepaticicola]
MVSSDTAIAIAFGLSSIFISMLGVWISYLTLRATSLDSRNEINYLVQTPQILRHEHTHFLASPSTESTRRRIPSIA